RELIITGFPEGENHNCDRMGCTSVEHVIYRGEVNAELTRQVSRLPTIAECDWCGEPSEEFDYPHVFDMVPGKYMCRGCWDHDREVYKGSYGEDIREFKP